jgi:hypothetical protein
MPDANAIDMSLRDDECPVCYTIQENVHTYVCGHKTCQACYDRICHTATRRCPLCRTPIEHGLPVVMADTLPAEREHSDLWCTPNTYTVVAPLTPFATLIQRLDAAAAEIQADYARRLASGVAQRFPTRRVDRTVLMPVRGVPIRGIPYPPPSPANLRKWLHDWADGALAGLDKQRVDLDTRCMELLDRETDAGWHDDLCAREDALDAREAALDARKAALDARKAALDAREAALDARQAPALPRLEAVRRPQSAAAPPYAGRYTAAVGKTPAPRPPAVGRPAALASRPPSARVVAPTARANTAAPGTLPPSARR